MLNDYLLDTLTTIQNNMKYILSFMIAMNFLVIFVLKFSIKLREKLSDFFDLPKKYTKEELGSVKEVLFLISHPDDEIMFFTPTIKTLITNGVFKMRILCLSNGNYEGLGKIREAEMNNVCKTLGIEFEIIDDDKMKDDIRYKWDSELIANKITEYMAKDNNLDKIGTIVTFDENGITNHPNHTSCYEGLM
jgi:LmbE family N-acetylglucosaminyl deacetylase